MAIFFGESGHGKTIHGKTMSSVVCYVQKSDGDKPSSILIPIGKDIFEEFTLIKTEQKQPEPIQKITWSAEEIRAYDNDRMGFMNALNPFVNADEMISIANERGGKLLENITWLLTADIEELVKRFAGSLPKS